MKTLIFDFDGTIADSFETLLGIFEEITARPQKLTAQEIKDLRGKSLKDIIMYLRIKRWQIPRLLIKAKRLVSLKMSLIQTFPGMSEVLKQLDKSGHRMYILSTNNSGNIERFLRKNRLDGYFTKIYGDIGLRSKSSALRKIIKKEGLKADDCIYIGDEARDVEAAGKAGVVSIGVTWGFNNAAAIKKSNPSAIASSPKNLLKIIN